MSAPAVAPTPSARLRTALSEHGTVLSMLLVFAAMTLVTRWWTLGWAFVSPENLSNLAQQVTQTGILAIGMTMVILIGGIDLSVGSILAVSATVAAQAAAGLDGFGTAGAALAVAAALAAGAALGAWNGVLIARLRILPFVVTLAMLTIARGIALLVSGAQSVRVKADLFRWLGVYSLDRLVLEGWYRLAGLPAAAAAALEAKGVPAADRAARYVEGLFLPDRLPSGLPHPAKAVPGEAFPFVTVGLAAAAFLVWLAFEIRRARRRRAAGGAGAEASVSPARVAAVAAAFAASAAVFAAHQGVPVMVVLFAALALLFSFVLRRTVFGRHLYAIGGNREAAHLSGVNVERCTFAVFVLMGLLSGLAGVVSTCRSQAASPATQGVLAELDAIAAVVVGGTSLSGGIGTIGGTVVGVLIIGVVVNAMVLMALPNEVQLIFRGLLIMAAVLVDVRTKRRTAV